MQCESPNSIMMKKCECGCGELVSRRFLSGHNLTGNLNQRWGGGRKVHSAGYVLITIENHPRKNSDGYVNEHFLVAEKALGKYLPAKAIIHHIDGNPSNNKNNNIVICENRKYHNLLHVRKRAIDACGNPKWRKCYICKKYDDPKNLLFTGKTEESPSVIHQACRKEALVLWRKYKNAKLHDLPETR